jgi:hypothetical protein
MNYGEQGVPNCDTLQLNILICISINIFMNIYLMFRLIFVHFQHPYEALYSRQTMRWSLRGVNILSAVRGEYKACRWTEDFLLVNVKVT